MTDNVPLPAHAGVKVTRETIGTFYSALYTTIESHIEHSTVKPRSWKVWEEWKSNGMRKRMTSYVKLSKLLLGNEMAFCKSLLTTDNN